MYSVNRGDWQPYTGVPIVITDQDEVAAYAESLKTDEYISSLSRSEFYESVQHQFAGYTTGDWRSSQTASDDVLLEWGTDDWSLAYSDGRVFLFEGISFQNVVPGELFQLGNLTLANLNYNGQNGDEVYLDLDVNVDYSTTITQDNTTTTTYAEGSDLFEFDFTFNDDMWAVHLNNGHGNNLDGVDSSNEGQGGGGPGGETDLSCVETGVCIDDEGGIGNQFSDLQTGMITVDGITYGLTSMIGENTESGFNALSQFYVPKGSYVTTGIWGYFTGM